MAKTKIVLNLPNFEHLLGKKFHHPFLPSTNSLLTVECISLPISAYLISIILYPPVPMVILFSIDKMHSTEHAVKILKGKMSQTFEITYL